jgi:hypothetical protein
MTLRGELVCVCPQCGSDFICEPNSMLVDIAVSAWRREGDQLVPDDYGAHYDVYESIEKVEGKGYICKTCLAEFDQPKIAGEEQREEGSGE